MKSIALWAIIGMIIFGPGTVQANPNGIEPAFRNLKDFFRKAAIGIQIKRSLLRLPPDLQYAVSNEIALEKRFTFASLTKADNSLRCSVQVLNGQGHNFIF